MKIRRRSEKSTTASDGVPPLHTLITCTYQKLFKRDLMDHNGGPQQQQQQPEQQLQQKKKLHRRHESSSWAPHGPRLREVDALEGGDKGDGDHDARPSRDLDMNPLLPKRRKVKSTRYADFAEEVLPHSVKAEKRSRHIEKDSAQDAADYTSTVASSKEALIASIFFVFDTVGKSGLTASEVVAIMLEQGLPGLKEGGARHTVQVANVLRRSRHFLAIGNKQYLPCTRDESSGSGSVSAPPKPKRGGGARSSSSIKAAESCKLYDGSGWHCSRDAHTGFSLCVHHLEMINRPLGAEVQQSPPSPPAPAPAPPSPPASEDSEEDEDIGPAAAVLAKWGRDHRAPGSQKRKMLSLMSIK